MFQVIFSCSVIISFVIVEGFWERLEDTFLTTVSTKTSAVITSLTFFMFFYYNIKVLYACMRNFGTEFILVIINVADVAQSVCCSIHEAGVSGKNIFLATCSICLLVQF